MQAIAPVTAHNPNNHTKQEILDVLYGKYGSRKFTFRYELLDQDNLVIQDLTNIISCSVRMSWLAPIKRTAEFEVADDGVIDYLVDRIKPWVRVALPPYGVNDWAEWPQGVFILSSPTRGADQANRITRTVEAYDLLQTFQDDVVDRYHVAAATKYTDAIITLLGGISQHVTKSTKLRTIAREWNPGNSKLQIINDLCAAIDYNSMFFDENGSAIIQPYQSPDERAEEFTYSDNSITGMIIPDVDQTLDLFDIPNKWILYVSNPEQTHLISTFTNNDPSNITSTVRRGRTISRYEEVEDIPDQATLDSRVARMAFEASRLYESVEFSTPIMPFHSGNDVYRITYGPLAINTKYQETMWEMRLKAGATMSHKARRMVTL